MRRPASRADASQAQGVRVINRSASDLSIACGNSAPIACSAGQFVTVSAASRGLGLVSVSRLTDHVASVEKITYNHKGELGQLASSLGTDSFDLYYSESPFPALVIFEKRDLSRWMASMPDESFLGDLCLPGTHDSCALYGYPISQCQQTSTPPDVQLLNGVRFMDVRMKVVGDELKAYHGIRPQRSTFLTFIGQIDSFLRTNPSETIIILMKEEADGSDQDPRFSRILHDNLLPQIQQGRWFLENRIPNLGEVRGKAILMSRFDVKEGDGWVGEDGIGIHPSTWPDSARNGFEWDCAGTTFRTQDWYRLSTFMDIPEKYAAVVSHVSPKTPRPAKSFTLSYTSAAGYPFALPTHIAKGFGWPGIGLGVLGMNARLAQYLIQCAAEGTQIKACFAMDFFSEIANVNGLIVQMNFLHQQIKLQ